MNERTSAEELNN